MPHPHQMLFSYWMKSLPCDQGCPEVTNIGVSEASFFIRASVFSWSKCTKILLFRTDFHAKMLDLSPLDTIFREAKTFVSVITEILLSLVIFSQRKVSSQRIDIFSQYICRRRRPR